MRAFYPTLHLANAAQQCIKASTLSARIVISVVGVGDFGRLAQEGGKKIEKALALNHPSAGNP